MFKMGTRVVTNENSKIVPRRTYTWVLSQLGHAPVFSDKTYANDVEARADANAAKQTGQTVLIIENRQEEI
jgi:hypothetical protein